MNTKMIVLWGFEPTVTHFGPGHQLAYYIRMARERGIPVICIDPRYTVAAEVLADQWIPIKPGTDAAMMLAVADAAARGIKDGDLARIHNDKGVAVIPAYVTSRLLPGIVVIHHGGWYEPDKEGVDRGCTPNIFLTDEKSPVTAPSVTNLVEVERYTEGS